MSLFPAYSDRNAPQDSTSRGSGGNYWLSNNSFIAGPSNRPSNALSNAAPNKPPNKPPLEAKKCQGKKKKIKVNERGERVVRRKTQKAIDWYKKKSELRKENRKRLKYCKKNVIIEKISDLCDLYCIDKTRRLDFLCCSTLTRPIKPRYRVYKKNFIGPKNEEPKNEKFRRYFMKKIAVTNTKEPVEKKEKQLKVTQLNAEFNNNLGKDSSVADWIKYAEFQDEYFAWNYISYAATEDKKTAISKKKLSILERGMHFHPRNEELLKYWIKIASEALSTEEMLETLDLMIISSPGNLPLWINYISLTQQSLSRCTFSSVTTLYKRAVNCLKNFKVDNIASRDSDILELLFHYCKFLQDTGHWELLWTILKTIVLLNFGVDINVDLGITDYRVKKTEDEIIWVEGQPIWVTWKMVEALREGLHFLPVADSLYYPQRCVTLNNSFDFIVHFHPDVHFKIIINFLMLLKVPLLPFNTTISKALHETRSIWTLDSPELVLSAAFSAPASDVKIDYLRFVAQIPAGPQYLRNLEGQQEFLELVQKVFYEFMGVLQGKQKIFLGIWWLRFNRWLCILEKHSLATLQLPAKKMKNFFKDFMKNPENSQGNTEGGIKTLKTLISARRSVHQLADELEKAALCQVYRSLCELYIETGQPEEAQKVLIHLALGSSSDTKHVLKLALNKYEDDLHDIVQKIGATSDSLEQILIPQFSLEWIHCYLWLLALSYSVTCAKTLYLRLDLQLKKNDSLFSNYAREYLCEAAATISWRLEKNNSLSLTSFIKDGLVQYPENLKILTLVASKKLEEHGLWLTFKQSFLNPPTIFGCIVLITIALSRSNIDEGSFRNRLKSLFRQVSSNEGKLSSIIHRLRLMFLFDFDKSQLETAQIHAIASCPWSKSVYMSSISALPNKMSELTDVMIEKELRIHVTPDEIVEMRG